MPSLTFRQSIVLILGFICLLAIVTWGFSPGMGGTLIFDDIPNFLPWHDLGDINTGSKVLTFIVSGIGFPGRPLSLLSFLLDDQSWSPDTHALKRTNLAIHLINACLVFWLALKILNHLLPQNPAKQAWLALLIASIWALHPLQVSNVSYIIQRMNLLCTTLELSGLLIFLYGRAHLALSARKALLMCSIGAGIFMPLAILAKENGLLLCAFALLAESYCFKPERRRIWQSWKALFLWLPLLAFVAYCLMTYRGFTTGFETRNFNAWERLLTQGPVIVDYLNKLLLPRQQGTGLYFDNFPVSHSLANPISTLLCWLTILSLIGIALWQKHRLPLFSFGILFYFSGHLMESTVLPLELYFEHRNYLPQLGLWLALIGLTPLIPQRMLPIFAAATVVMLTLLALITRSNAALWSQPDQQTIIWHQNNPGSLRTTLAYANFLLQEENYTEIDKVLESGRLSQPNKLIIPISQRYIHCYRQGKSASFTNLASFARHADYETASIIMLERMRKLANNPEPNPTAPQETNCAVATPEQISLIYTALLENPNFSPKTTRTRLFEYQAEIAVGQGRLNEAMHFYDAAFANSKNPIYPYRQALLLQSAGLSADGIAFIDIAGKSLTFRYRHTYPELTERIALLRQQLQHEANTP